MITIHGIFGSPFVSALRIGLDEKGLPWAWAPFPMGAQKQEPYVSMHPFGKIPAIEDDGFVLYETQAMLRHIDRAKPSPALTPDDPKRAARMDQLLCILDCYVWPEVSRPIGFNRIIAPLIGAPVDEDAVAVAVPRAQTALKAIAALHAGPFLTGEAISLADIAIQPHLGFLSRTPEGAAMLPEYPALVAWLALMQSRQSVQDSTRSPEKVFARAREALPA